MAKTSADAPRRIGEFVPGIGERLDAIADQDVIVTRIRVTTRPMRGEEKPFVEIDVQGDDGETVEYHAWSASLAEKLGDIPDEAFPLTARFFRTRTSGGFEVWNVE